MVGKKQTQNEKINYYFGSCSSFDKLHSKIVSMVESHQKWTSDNIDKRYLIGAYSQTEGAYNTSRVKALPKWKNKYPAFSWCDHLGNGWYIPSIEELKAFVTDADIHNIVNRIIVEHKGTKICGVADGTSFYLSSTESGKSLNTVCVYTISIGNKKSEIAEMPKKWSYRVRAVAIF